MGKEKKEFGEKPVPGLMEALYPHTGNGAAWATDGHTYLLRMPDPAKSLGLDNHVEPRLPEKVKEELPAVKVAIPEPETELPVVSEEKPEKPARKKSSKKAAGKKGKSEAKSAKKAVQSAQSAGELTPVAGNDKEKGAVLPEEKLADVLPKPRAVKPESEEPKTFTAWLRSLGGSDYVHPYGDDFALEEREAPETGISETYADLLAAQGYVDRAIEMYKKLIEKNPEKSAFFAARIEALRRSS